MALATIILLLRTVSHSSEPLATKLLFTTKESPPFKAGVLQLEGYLKVSFFLRFLLFLLFKEKKKETVNFVIKVADKQLLLQEQ